MNSVFNNKNLLELGLTHEFTRQEGQKEGSTEKPAKVIFLKMLIGYFF